MVPEMESHGASTAKGQAQVMEHLGVGEKEIGRPVRATMESILLDETPSGVEVFMYRNACEADAVIFKQGQPTHHLPRNRREWSNEDARYRARQAEERPLGPCSGLGTYTAPSPRPPVWP